MGIRERILYFKKLYSAISISLFVVLISFCLFSLPKLNLAEISLSRFGISNGTSYIWNTGLFLIGILLYSSALKNVFIYHEDNIINNRLTLSFTIASIMLLATAMIDMHHRIHNLIAILYFVGYTFSIFLFGYKLIESDIRLGVTSMILSICSFIIPIISIFIFRGLAIPEILHTSFIFIWDICLTYDAQYKSLLRKLGL